MIHTDSLAWRDLPDIHVENHGTLFLVTPCTANGKHWLEDHVDPEATWFGPPKNPALVVEDNYIEGLVGGMFHDGLKVA